MTNKSRLLRAEEQDGNADVVLDAGGGGAEEDVSDEAVSVGAHRHQVAALLLDPLDDLGGSVAVSQFGLGGNAGGLKLVLHLLQVREVGGDLGTDGVGPIGARGPSVGHVQQDDAAVHELGQLLDVLDDRPVGGRAVQRHENGVIHGVGSFRAKGSCRIGASSPDDRPRQACFQRVGQAVDVHGGDQDSAAAPAGDQQEPASFPLAHPLAGAGELQQRKHGKRQLQRQHHLAEGQQVVHAAVAAQADDEDRRQNGQRAGDQPPHPGRDPPVHEAFHHHLPGQRAGDGAALPAGQQRHGEQRAGGGGAQQRRQRQIGDADPVAVGAEGHDLAARHGHALLAEKHHRRQHQDGRVDEEGDGQRHRRVDGVEPDGAADGALVLLQACGVCTRAECR